MTLADSARLEQIDLEMQRLIDAGHFAGAATEAWHRNELVHRSGVGVRDLATGSPMTADTIVRVFSMTKPVTAVAMMILHDQGKWRAEDPIANYLPELGRPEVFEGMRGDGTAILHRPRAPATLAQLLTHTAGFSYGFEAGWIDDRYREADLWRAADLYDFVRRVAGLPLAYQPGTRWEYSVSMELQGAIIERLSGMSLPQFYARYIFDPLAMADTAFHVPAEKTSRLAALYAWHEGRLKPADNPLGDRFDAPPTFATGGGGLYSTATDYARFGRMLLGLGQLEGQRIASEGAMRAMMSSQIGPSIVRGGFGIGFQQIRPGYEFGYNGVVVTDPVAAGVALGAGSYLWDGLACTWFWVDPQNQVVFVGMVQRIVDPDVPLVQPISQLVLREALRSPPAIRNGQ